MVDEVKLGEHDRTVDAAEDRDDGMFLRQLFEKQAIRRMEEGTLTAEETENLGVALMRLEATVRDLAERFGLRPEELNLDLGPLGRLR